MKVCKNCLMEFDGRDGENTCRDCEQRRKRNGKAKSRRAAMREVYESLGLTKVRGALGGVYFE
jgi:hypothetical protein